jgi:hypothetical protein
LDANTFIDGTPLNESGLNSLRMFTEIPSSMLNFLQEREYNDEMVKFVNAELDRRETEWNGKGKDAVVFLYVPAKMMKVMISSVQLCQNDMA